MAGTSIPKDRMSARIAVVEQHIRLENKHDLEGVLGTFGDTARYDDEPWGEHYEGRSGVRLFYEQLMKALPNLEIEVQRRHVVSSFPSAACTPSTPMTVWRAKKSTTIGGQY
jgi:hypothetical protein